MKLTERETERLLLNHEWCDRFQYVILRDEWETNNI